MSNAQFGLILLSLGIVYGLENKITKYINDNFIIDKFENFRITNKHISYLLFIILSITLVVGMLSGDKIVNSNYGNVSDGFENVKPKDMDRPNPLFDIDTYW